MHSRQKKKKREKRTVQYSFLRSYIILFLMRRLRSESAIKKTSTLSLAFIFICEACHLLITAQKLSPAAASLDHGERRCAYTALVYAIDHPSIRRKAKPDYLCLCATIWDDVCM